MAEQKEEARAVRREKVGVVTSDKMTKTIKVEVGRRVTHAKYKKTINRTSVFKAHDEKEEAGFGDRFLFTKRPL